jgi:hypothetical protein
LIVRVDESIGNENVDKGEEEVVMHGEKDGASTIMDEVDDTLASFKKIYLIN